MDNILSEKIRARLRLIGVEHARLERERNHLVALLEMYDHGPATNGTRSSRKAIARSKRAPSRAAPFRAIAGGPSERIRLVVNDTPGLSYSEVIDRAVEGIVSTAGDPRRSLGSTLQSLVKRGKVERRDGKHYPPRT
jgi:hypothetical protein